MIKSMDEGISVSKKMKTLFYPEYHRLEINNQPIPDYSDNEVLLKVSACGICGSELETFKTKSSRRIPPLIMGHEFCGEVVAVGKLVKDWQPGMPAVSNSIVSCGHCNMCISGHTNLCVNRQVFGMHRKGAFAEYVNVPASCLIPLAAETDPRQACLTEPLANGVHMVRLTEHVKMKNILVIGAGPIGLMTQQAFQTLRNVNTVVMDIREERIAVAKKLGAVSVINPSTQKVSDCIAEATSGTGFDLVVDAVGSAQTNTTGLQAVKQGGTMVMIGLHENNKSISSYDLVLPEKQVMGSYAATQKDMQDALQLIEEKRVDTGSWIHYYDLNDGVQAFYDMMDAKENHIKSVLIIGKK